MAKTSLHHEKMALWSKGTHFFGVTLHRNTCLLRCAVTRCPRSNTGLPMTVQPFVQSFQTQHPQSGALEHSIDAVLQNILLDHLFRGMAHRGLGVAAIAAFLGLTPQAVEERAAALDLPPPHDRPMRKPGPRGWSIDDVRRFIALWIENVATKSIAAAIGRSKGSLYYKRKWLGLEPRKLSELRERSVEACAATRIFWLPAPVADVIAGPIKNLPSTLQPRPKQQDKWNPERSKRCSYLAFAGLSNAAAAARMSAEFGIEFSEKAVADQLSRVQAIRDRSIRALPDIGDDEIESRAAAHIALWALQWRKCEGTNHYFWYSRLRGGPRNTCREFQRRKFRNKRQERECAARFGIA